MATIVDSNVVIDLVEPDSSWTAWSQSRVSGARLDGTLVYNIVIAAEVAHEFRTEARYRAVFQEAIWEMEDIPFEAGLLAGWAHREYRARGGTRERTLPDFLIGAHAATAGHRLLTRDAGSYRAYLPSLEIISPETHP